MKFLPQQIPTVQTSASAVSECENRIKMAFQNLFKKAGKCAVIGMVHVWPLPGTPLFNHTIDEIISRACKETEIYLKNNIDGLLVENMHDIPYVQSKELTPEITASMTRICTEIKKIVPEGLPCGVQVLAGGNRESLAICKALSWHFIRAEGFVFSHIADEGFTDACAGNLLRYRKRISAEQVLIFADIKKKHSSHSITSDVSLAETAKAAEFFLADGLIVTGTATGSPADTKHLKEVQEACSLPVLIGSGVTVENLQDYIHADGIIVGSHFKRGGFWKGDLDGERIRNFTTRKHELLHC